MERAKRRRRRLVVAVALASCLLLLHRTRSVCYRPGGLLYHIRQRVRRLFLLALSRCQQWLTGCEVGSTTALAQQVVTFLMCTWSCVVMIISVTWMLLVGFEQMIVIENLPFLVTVFLSFSVGFLFFQPSPLLSLSVSSAFVPSCSPYFFLFQFLPFCVLLMFSHFLTTLQHQMILFLVQPLVCLS